MFRLAMMATMVVVVLLFLSTTSVSALECKKADPVCHMMLRHVTCAPSKTCANWNRDDYKKRPQFCLGDEICAFKKTSMPKCNLNLEQRTGLDAILLDPVGNEFFAAFSVGELSHENIDFYNKVRNWKTMVRNNKMVKSVARVHAQNIFHRFLKATSPKELNVIHADVAILKTKLDKIVKDRDDNIDVTLFDTVLQSVLGNLCDTYSRIILTESYKLYCDNVSKHCGWKTKFVRDVVDIKNWIKSKITKF